MPPGSFGRVRAWNDYTAIPPHTAADTVPLANGSLLGGGWGLIGDDEGTVIATVDEPGGIIAITTDVANDDNNFIVAGTWTPASGGMQMEARIKIIDSLATTRVASWVGWNEIMAVAAPAMPAETSGTTTTYNGTSSTGSLAGFLFDSDSTSLIWRFVVGEDQAALATVGPTGTVGTALGIDAEAGITVDRWWVFRVEIAPDGIAIGFIGDDSGTTNVDKTLREVGRSTAAMGTGRNMHASVGIENRSSANEIIEVDYTYASGFRDYSFD